MGIFVILYIIGNLIISQSTNITSIQTMNVDLTGLTVSSLVFNHDQRLPSWIQHILGEKSVYFAANGTHYQGPSSGRAVDDYEADMAHQAVMKEFQLPKDAMKPLCSIEILGFVYLDRNWPFFRARRQIGPLLGQGKLNVPMLSGYTPCYYRALYENWRPESDRASPNHWSTVFYCPIHDQLWCSSFIEANTKQSSVEMTLSFTANQTTWTNNFVARISSPRASVDTSVQDIGICMAIPYTSTDADKVSAL